MGVQIKIARSMVLRWILSNALAQNAVASRQFIAISVYFGPRLCQGVGYFISAPAAIFVPQLDTLLDVLLANNRPVALRADEKASHFKMAFVLHGVYLLIASDASLW